MEVRCSLRRFRPWGEAVKTFEKIELANKLDALESYLEDLYGDTIDGSKLNDLLAYENEDLLATLGLTEPEEIEESFDLKKLNSVLEEALHEDEEDIDILTFKFDFEVNGTDILCKNEYGYEVEVQLDDDEVDNEEDIFNEIETQLDDNAANIAEDGREITGTEIVGFKYDEETKKGSFEFNIFCEGNEDFDESLNERKVAALSDRVDKDIDSSLTVKDLLTGRGKRIEDMIKRLKEKYPELNNSYELENLANVSKDLIKLGQGYWGFDESLNEAKQFYLGWRSNPQLKNGGYYKKFGQLTKADAKKKEKCVYGSMSLTAYDTEEEYNKAIEDAQAKGMSVQ